MLGLVLLSAVVLVIVVQAAQPEVWRRVFARGEQALPQRDQSSAARHVDTRLRTDEALNVFHSPRADERSPNSGAGEQQRFPGVRSEYLSVVRDDTVLLSKENDAWFHLFDVLASAAEHEIQDGSEADVAHVQLYNQPNAYRGRLVTIAGRLRGAQYLEATENSYGVSGYHKLWIETAAGANPPIVIAYVLDLPEELKDSVAANEKVSQQVRLSGFFFKRLAYKAQDTIRLAPLLVGKTIDVQPTAEAPGKVRIADPIVSNTLVALVLLGLVWFAIRRSSASRGANRSSRRFFIGKGGPASSSDPAAFLNQLSLQPNEASKSSLAEGPS